MSKTPPLSGELFGALGMLLAACTWGAIGPAMREALALGVTPVQVTLIRASGSTLVVGLWLLFKNPSKMRCPLKEIPSRMLNGLFGVVGIFLLTNIGLVRIPVGFATILFYTAPFWVLILEFLLFRQRLSKIQILTLALAFGGVWVAMGRDLGGSGDPIGVGVMLLSGFSYAAYLLNGRYGSGGRDPLGNYFSTYLWGALFVGIIYGFFGSSGPFPPFSWRLLGVLSYLVLVNTVLAYALVQFSLRHLTGGVASILSMSEIAFAIFWGMVLLHQIPSFATLAGGGMIAGGILVILLEQSQKKGGYTAP